MSVKLVGANIIDLIRNHPNSKFKSFETMFVDPLTGSMNPASSPDLSSAALFHSAHSDGISPAKYVAGVFA